MRRGIAGLGGVARRGLSVLAFRRAAPFYARYTIRFHLPAELLIGVFSGLFLLADLVSKKALSAPAWMVALQTSVPTMALILAMVFRDLLAGADRRRTILLSGFLGKGLLILVAFVTSPGLLLVVVILVAVVDSAFIPLRNTIFRSNYGDAVRGRLYGRVIALTYVVLVVVNLSAAKLLDRWEESYRILFPLAALAGVAAHAIYARVRVRGGSLPAPASVRGGSFPTRVTRPLVRAWSTTVRILSEDARFRAYERNFFIYGIAFLMNLPLAVLLIVDELDLAYDEASWARFVVPHLLMILCSGFAGKFLDRTHPAVLMAAACVGLCVHSVLLAFAGTFLMLLVSYALYGIAMTAVNLSWNLGPMEFAPTERQTTDYMAVHVTLTGLRGILAPGLALGAVGLFGLRSGFLFSAGLWLLAAILMFRLGRKIRREGVQMAAERITPAAG